MTCDSEFLAKVPLFSLLDADERAVLASHVEVRLFEAHQRIYRAGDAGGKGYVVVAGTIRVTLIDDDHQEVTIAEPDPGGVFGFASLLDGTPHQTSAIALEPATCIEIDSDDLRQLLIKKPHAGMDMLAVLGSQVHSAQRLVQMRSVRNPNEIIEQATTPGDRLADAVARFGGSWRFIISFGAVLATYTAVNVFLGGKAWDPYPFILLNLLLSMLAAIQAPVIMMSQNRQDTKDRTRGELDFEVNRIAESEIRGISKKLHEMNTKLEDVESLLRKESAKPTL